METWELNGLTLEYDDDTHTYLVDGVIVPSVTQVLSVKFGKKYDHVDAETLKRACNYGTAVHKTIENYCTDGTDDGSRELRDFKFLKEHYKIKPMANEIPVIVSVDDKPIMAGRLDMVAEINGAVAVADIKTTATLDKEYLAYQLNLYRIGLRQCYGIEATALYGIHLRHDKRKVVNIPIKESFTYALINDYLEREKKNMIPIALLDWLYRNFGIVTEISNGKITNMYIEKGGNA